MRFFVGAAYATSSLLTVIYLFRIHHGLLFRYIFSGFFWVLVIASYGVYFFHRFGGYGLLFWSCWQFCWVCSVCYPFSLFCSYIALLYIPMHFARLPFCHFGLPCQLNSNGILLASYTFESWTGRGRDGVLNTRYSTRALQLRGDEETAEGGIKPLLICFQDTPGGRLRGVS